MDPAEYLAFLPLLIYGIGITDLLSQWKRFFIKKGQYPLYIVLTVMLIERAVYNVFIYLDLVDTLPEQSYYKYLIFLIPPFLFQMVVNVFTPDKGSETRLYFITNLRLIFVLMALFTVSHFLYNFNEHPFSQYVRILVIIVSIAIAIFRKNWLIYLLVALWFSGFLLRPFLSNP